MLRALVVHNSYQQRGGEDSVVESEIALLRARGHDVVEYGRSNDECKGTGHFDLAVQALWSRRSTTESAQLFVKFRPDVVHVHNTFPLISPSLYWAAAEARVPVVQTLHNFRLMCLNGLFLRDNHVCEDCLGHLPWRGVMRKCYRGESAASGVLAGVLTLHRGLATYRTKVSRYIALNDFCRRKFIEGGLPTERIVIKPNFVDFPVPESLPRQGLLFVGRLSVEKGVQTLARAAALLPLACLQVAGEGPAAAMLDGLGNVTRLGSVPGQVVRQQMNSSVALVVPSIWYENFPRTIVEAFACSLPVIASHIGALPDLVKDGETGLLFEPGNPLVPASLSPQSPYHLPADAANPRLAQMFLYQRFMHSLRQLRLREFVKGPRKSRWGRNPLPHRKAAYPPQRPVTFSRSVNASVVVKPSNALATNALAKAPRSCGGRPTPHQADPTNSSIRTHSSV